ncbi:MAG: 4Fe-4S dicluster domain-containing protein [Candidatus Bathyarchaeales archaeon]
MVEVDVYERLREKISLWPIRTPRTKEVMEILKILFTEEEAEFLIHFTAPYQDPETIEQMVEKTGKPKEKVQAIANRLVSRGLLFKFTSKRDGNVYYSLMPMIPGIFEFYFSSGCDSDEKRKIGELFERHYFNGGGFEIGASNYPFVRVMPIEKTITVNKEISEGHMILPFEKMSEFIKTSRKIAVVNCACRTKKRCEHPLEVCMAFDHYADYMVERGFGRYLTVEEALELLEETEKAGLVHSTINTQTRPQFICNCCTCACLILRGLTELHNPRAIAKSNFIPVRDEKLCNLCKRCISICPMKANLYHAPHDKETEKIILLEERCIGCGLCAYHCPTKAIKMVKVRDSVPEMTLREALERVEAERIH